MSSTIRTCAALQRRVEVLEDAHDAGGLRRGAVGRDGHEVDLAADVQMAHQVGQEQEGALQDPDQEQVLALVVAGDLLRHRPDAVLQVVRLDEDLADLFAHGAAESRRQASRTRRPGFAVRRETARPVATPGTHAISPSETTTGSRWRALARDLAVGEQVLQRLRCRPARAGASGPRAARRGPRAWRASASRGERPVGDRERAPLAHQLAVAERDPAGDRRASARIGLAVAPRGSILTRPYSEMARRPPGRSSVAVPACAASARIASACAAMRGARPPAASSASRCRTSRASAGASRELAASRVSRAAARRSASAASTAASSTAASSRSSASVARMFAPPPGAARAAPGGRRADQAARGRRRSRSPRATPGRARGSTPRSPRASCPAAGGRPGPSAPASPAAPAGPARRRAGRARSRPGRSRCGRRRSARRAPPRAAPPRRSAPPAPTPARCRPARPRAHDEQLDAQPRAERAAERLVGVGLRPAQPVVDVQRPHRAGLARPCGPAGRPSRARPRAARGPSSHARQEQLRGLVEALELDLADRLEATGGARPPRAPRA